MKTNLIRGIAAFIVPLVWAAAHAQDVATEKIKEEISKQEKIYSSESNDGYTVDRSLTLYADGLPSGFREALTKLGPDERWLDIGAGKGYAILDYYIASGDRRPAEPHERRVAKAQAIAMSIEDRRTPLWQKTAASVGADRLQYLAGKRLAQYSVEELGRFQLITDVIGGFSYTDNLSRFMEKVMGLLEVNGTFFTVLQDVRHEAGTNQPHYKGAPFLTEIVNRDGSELKICSWLKRMTCAEVTCEARAQWQPPMEAFRVKKVCGDVTVPALTPVHYQAGTPPERRFSVTEPAVRPVSQAVTSR